MSISVSTFLAMTEMSERSANGVFSMVFGFVGTPDKLELPEVLVMLAAYVLRQAKLESEEYIPALKFLQPAIAKYSLGLGDALDEACRRSVEAKAKIPPGVRKEVGLGGLFGPQARVPGAFIEIMDRKYIGFAPPPTGLFNMDTGGVVVNQQGFLQPALLSEAIFLPGVYLRTVSKSFGHGDAEELWSAGLLAWQFHDERTP